MAVIPCGHKVRGKRKVCDMCQKARRLQYYYHVVRPRRMKKSLNK